PRTLTLVSPGKKLNAPGGSRAKVYPPHEPQRRTCAVANKPRQQRRACARADCAAYLSGHSEASHPTDLPLTRPRAFRFVQRDAQRRTETRRGSAGPTNGTRSGAAAELCRSFLALTWRH